MVDNQKLHDMVDAILDDNKEQAQVAFHSYLEDKMREKTADIRPSVDYDSTDEAE